MPAPPGDMHKGSRRHMRWAPETSWGLLPEGPSWTCIPIRRGHVTLRSVESLFAPASAFAGWRRRVLLPRLQQVVGRLEAPAWPEVTAYVLQAALWRDPDPAGPACQEPGSYSIDFFTPPDPRRYRGVMVERVEIQADPGGLGLRLSLRGWKEEANGALTEDQFSYDGLTPGSFRLRDAAVTLGGANLTDVESFTISADNHLNAGPPTAGRVAYLAAGTRTVRLKLLKLHLDDVLNEAIRVGSPLSFSARFVHPAGHELTLELPALQVQDNREPAPPADVARTHAVLEARADEDGRDLIYQVLPPGTTTTTTAP